MNDAQQTGEAQDDVPLAWPDDPVAEDCSPEGTVGYFYKLILLQYLPGDPQPFSGSVIDDLEIDLGGVYDAAYYGKGLPQAYYLNIELRRSGDRGPPARYSVGPLQGTAPHEQLKFGPFRVANLHENSIYFWRAQIYTAVCGS